MIALTPIAPGTLVHPIGCDIPRLISELAPSVTGREANINLNRARLQRMFIRQYYPLHEFVLLVDSDVVVTADVIRKLQDAWKPGTTPCALTKQSAVGHVVTSCALIHRADYEKVNYLDNVLQCQCLKLPSPFYVEGAVGYEVGKIATQPIRRLATARGVTLTQTLGGVGG